MKRNIFLYTISMCMILTINASAGVIFEDNFDSHPDWTIAQEPLGGSSPLEGSTGLPNGWSNYYNGKSYCSGVGNNNMYINGTNPRGGTGKSMTFWDESCTNGFEDSDGNLGKEFGQDYSGLYVRFFIKFQPGYQWQGGTVPQHKFYHIWSYQGSGPKYAYFGQGNEPGTSGGFLTYSGNIYYYGGYRGEVDYYLQGTPSYTANSPNATDQVDLGPVNTVIDGNWHCLEFYEKMNTNTGSTFHADGIHRFWLDGVMIFETTTIPWSSNGSVTSPRRGFNAVAIGGNNNNLWTNSGVEQWYAIDDIVISTDYIGPSYVIGGGGVDNDAPDHVQNVE